MQKYDTESLCVTVFLMQAETWTLNKDDRKRTDAFTKCIWVGEEC